MKIKIIKKMLSALLTISSLATATFFVRAENGDQHDLESQIAECDVIIKECNETILDFEREKDSNIGSINDELQTLDEIKKILGTGEILECDLQDLENKNQNLLQKIEYIEKNYQDSIKLACETRQQQIDKKSELKKKLCEIEKKEKISEQTINNLISHSEILKTHFQKSYADTHLLRLNRLTFLNPLGKCHIRHQHHPLSKNESENLQTKCGTSDQNKKNTALWQMINSGAQYYKPNHVADNLCWLHSATNVQNYYNNMKKGSIVKGQTQVVEKYKQIMGAQFDANNINGSMKEFDSIAEYLQKCGLGSFQMIISSSSNNAQQKVKNTAKELLKARFNKIQNASPVIGHVGGINGHFITIADYDQSQDQFLMVDSSADQSIEARVVWIKSEEFLKLLIKQGFSGEHTIELDFTSSVPGFRSVGLTVNENNSMVQTDLTAENAEKIQTSIDTLKNMIEHY